MGQVVKLIHLTLQKIQNKVFPETYICKWKSFWWFRWKWWFGIGKCQNCFLLMKISHDFLYFFFHKIPTPPPRLSRKACINSYPYIFIWAVTELDWLESHVSEIKARSILLSIKVAIMSSTLLQTERTFQAIHFNSLDRLKFFSLNYHNCILWFWLIFVEQKGMMDTFARKWGGQLM